MDRSISRLAHYASFTTNTLLHGKWRVQILCAMCAGPVRLGELSRAIPRASKKVLTQNLRDLEAAGIVTRIDFSDLVLHVEYELHSDTKDSILALLNHVSEWGDTYLRKRGAKPQRNLHEHL
jgi:DNA-binding HxlR family transcriptional regulator